MDLSSMYLVTKAPVNTGFGFDSPPILVWVLFFFALMCGTASSQNVVTPERKVVLTDSAKEEKSSVQAQRLDRLKKDARVLYRNGAYDTAIKRFQEAYALSEDHELLFNIAISYQQMRDWDRCIGYLDRYLETAAQSPRRDRALNAKQSCSARRKVSQILRIESQPSGAAVYLGNRKSPIQGHTPFKKTLPVGAQRVWIELGGYEPVMRDIEVLKDAPFLLSIVLQKRNEPGWLFVDSTIRDAQVYLDGRALQLTPFPKPLSVPSGTHQLQIKRDGFSPISELIKINPFLLTKVDAPMARTSQLTSWRSPVGWVAVSLGVLAMVTGALAGRYADTHYNDTKEFDTFSGYERLGYSLGGGLTGFGLGLIIWDYARDDLLASDKNESYGQPVETPEPPRFEKRHGSNPTPGAP